MDKNKAVASKKTGKKRVAIMTWYTYMNYGSAFQAYAIKCAINKLGYYADFVNYNPSLVVWEKEPVALSSFFASGKSYFHNLMVKPDFSSLDTDREQLYLEFRNKHFTETEFVQRPQELHVLNRKYDAFVCGSDQIWSPLCFDPSYFLDFVDSAEKRVAYAPSIGVETIDDEDIRNCMENLLKGFIHLSCREDTGAKLIESLSGKSCEHVLDPTLLLNEEEWSRVANKNFDVGGRKYCLAYFLGESKTNWDLAKDIAKRKGLDLILVPVSGRDYKKQEAITNPVGPAEFLTLLRNADYVCTDSYHGLLFSINFKKDFSVFNRFSYKDSRCQNSRIDSCLNMFNLGWRKIERKSDFSDESIDYGAVKIYLEQERAYSLEYLKSSLESAIAHRDALEEKRSYLTNTCIGCGACEVVCPTGAIRSETTAEGFARTIIDEKACIDCRKCSFVCPLHEAKEPKVNEDVPVYAFRCNNEENIGSSSGGFAWAMGEYCVSRGLDVYGSVYDPVACKAKHVLGDSLELRQRMRGSKYIKSETKEIFREIYRGNKTQGVFLGTPCQVAALKNLLGDKAASWLFVDLICHGVPTQKLWDLYLDTLNINKGASVMFRDNSLGWSHLNISFADENNHKLYSCDEFSDLFYRVFKPGIAYYASCENCPFRDRSAADLRIGDYWNKEYIEKDLRTSMVLVLTKKGEKSFQEMLQVNKYDVSRKPSEDFFNDQYIPKRDCRYYSMRRAKFLSDLGKDKASLSEMVKKYCEPWEQGEKRERQIAPFVTAIKRILGK